VTVERETVVVTGLGATTPLGGDVVSTWAAMLAGRSGVRRLTEPWAKDLPVRIAAQAAVDPVEVVGRVQARRMDRCEQLAVVAAREAWPMRALLNWILSGSEWRSPAESAVSDRR